MEYLQSIVNNKEELLRITKLFTSNGLSDNQGRNRISIIQHMEDCYDVSFSKIYLEQWGAEESLMQVLSFDISIFKDKVMVYFVRNKEEFYYNSIEITDELVKDIIKDFETQYFFDRNEIDVRLKVSLPRLKSYDNAFVYLMKNTRNGYTKIGISKNPKHREKTLQSEEPEIDLIWKKEIPNAIGREIELHKKYSDKRIRGEWFDLTEQDIQNITLNI
jgi:predicted GIY-YIG superfamily endonuclease